MLSDVGYAYLRALLISGDIVWPEQAIFMFAGDFQAVHLQCHLTAMQVAVESGFPPVIGIQFIDLHGKLYPWPHMVNRRGDDLIDCSPRPNQPLLGFVEADWTALGHWRRIVIEYNAFGPRAEAPRWDDPLADLLSAEFLGPLRERQPESRLDAPPVRCFGEGGVLSAAGY